MDNEQRDKKLELIKNQVKLLAQSFDSVQIFTTAHTETEGTTSWQYGSGNWQARRGQVREWLTQEDEDARIRARESQDE